MPQTKLLPFGELNVEKQIPSVPGIYVVFSEKSFVRLRGKTNIVYIGKANNLSQRVPTLWKGTMRRAKERFDDLRKNTEYKNLYFRCYYPYPEPEKKEEEELKSFKRKHLELPPLNHNEPGSIHKGRNK
jgi:hypothetical protein